MSTTTLIILIVVLALLFGGGGGYYWRKRRYEILIPCPRRLFLIVPTAGEKKKWQAKIIHAGSIPGRTQLAGQVIWDIL